MILYRKISTDVYTFDSIASLDGEGGRSASWMIMDCAVRIRAVGCFATEVLVALEQRPQSSVAQVAYEPVAISNDAKTITVHRKRDNFIKWPEIALKGFGRKIVLRIAIYLQNVIKVWSSDVEYRALKTIAAYAPMRSLMHMTSFPKGFIWACATSAYQVEGGHTADGTVTHYRFSISWPRVLPRGTIDEINEQGLHSQVTLFHWDFPLALTEHGGWLNPLSIKWFSDYAQLCFSRFDKNVCIHFFSSYSIIM
uniref:Uncharacterized protein n=1 Tax=Parascaris equorum TaxID=6256 RepID=A0A914RQB1_PAREQ